jgi:glycosyltransferase involved in cell wall biosynthesis
VRMWRAAGRCLDAADAVALLALGEGEHLRRLTGWRADNAVLVPNGRPEDLDLTSALPWRERPVGSILVVGRVEPRKRQLELARSADRLGIPVRFVGPISDPGSGWAAEFEALAATSASVVHLGGVDRPEVLRLLGGTRVLVNASWVEVQSLVDLEAATMGCAVVTTPTGHSREWLGAAVTVPGTDSTDRLLQTAASIAAGDEGPEPPAYGWTWERAAALLAELYRAA